MATAVAQVLPKELRLTAPPTLPQARSYLFKQKSSLPTYSEKEVIQINIPRLQRSYLTKGSYLKFRLHLTGDWGMAEGYYNLKACLDTPGALGLIDKIEVYDYLGSTLLESTAGHGQLQALLLDIGTAPHVTNSHLNAVAGTGRSRFALDSKLVDNFIIGPGVNATQTAVTSTYQITELGALTAVGPSAGAVLVPPVKHGKTVAQALSQEAYFEFAIPLHSFLGTQSQQFVPLHNGFTIYLTLNSVNNVMNSVNQFAAVGNTTPALGWIQQGALTAMKVEEVYYCAQVLELGPVAESLLLSSSQGQPLVVHSKGWRNFVDSVNAGVSSYRLDLPLNVSSMTSLFWMMRPSADLNVMAKRCLSNRIRNNLQSWFFQYGSSILPQTSGIAAQSGDPLTASGAGYTEAYSELMKAAQQFSDPFTVNNTITADAYTNDSTSLDLVPELPYYNYGGGEIATRSSNVPGKFAAGLNLELVSKKNADLITGLNTNGMNISLTANFKPDVGMGSVSGAAVLARVDAWCVYDAYVNISPGLASTVAF